MSSDEITEEENEKWKREIAEGTEKLAKNLFGNDEEPHQEEGKLSPENIRNIFNEKSNKSTHSPQVSASHQPTLTGQGHPHQQMPQQVISAVGQPSHSFTNVASNPAFLNRDDTALESMQSNNQKSSYPVQFFPQFMQDVIYGLHRDTGIPHEVIGNVILSASAMACQPLFEVENPGGEPEPCSLFAITIADSGLGKSLIFEQIMPPFKKFNDEMTSVHSELQGTYKSKHRLWKRKQKAIDREYENAIDDELVLQEIECRVFAHDKTEPVPPKKIDLFYNNTTPATLINDLSNSFSLTLNLEEGYSFFKGYARDAFDIFNELWDKCTYNKSRTVKPMETVTLKINTPLSMSILVQPNVFDDYRKKYEINATGVGFFPRCLFVKAELDDGSKKIRSISKNTQKAVSELHCRFDLLIKKQRQKYIELNKINKNESATEALKDMLTVPSEIKQILEEKDSELNFYANKNEKWAHIRNSVLKSREKMLRLAGILQCLDECNKELPDMEITEQHIRNAAWIVEWYMDEASRIFPPEQTQNKKISDDDYLWEFLCELRPSCHHRETPYNYLSKNSVVQYSKFNNVDQLNRALHPLFLSGKVREGFFPGRKATFLIVDESHLHNHQQRKNANENH